MLIPPLGDVKIIVRNFLKYKIDDFLLDGNKQAFVESFSTDPNSLVTYNRLDIAIKIAYLQSDRSVRGYAYGLYMSHVNAFTLGGFTEPGNKSKDSAEKYIEEFNDVYSSLLFEGFSSEISYVPICRDGTLLNGAHRVAACYVAGRAAEVVVLDRPCFEYGYKFFEKRGMSVDQIEYSVIKFVEYASNVYVALLWPASARFDIDSASFFSKVIYDRKIDVTFKGLHNLVTQAYMGEPWLGGFEDGFAGARAKARECYDVKGSLRIVVFQSSSLSDVELIKREVRAYCGIGNGAIHTTDSKAEALNICQLLLNCNSRHFLNYGDPYKYKNVLDRIYSFKDGLIAEGHELDSVVIDGGSVLSIYGLRESLDLDYISRRKLRLDMLGIDCHDSQLIYHAVEKDCLIEDPGCFFYFNGLKFVSLKQLKVMKSQRLEGKDVLDLRLIDSKLDLQSRYSFLLGVLQLLQVIKFKTLVLESGLAAFLRRFRYYEDVRRLYRKLFRK